MSIAGTLSGCREEDDMGTVKLDRERGQVLIMVAVMVVALFGFLALALDVGNIYGGRRRMQNAADAGALAGARDLCFGSGDPVQAKLVAEDYAINRNGAQSADVVVQDGITVSVVARQTLDTFVAGVIGIRTADVAAEAAAVCGKVTSLCGLWPIAFPEDEFLDVECGDEILIWEKEVADCDTYSCTCHYGSGGGEAAIPNLEARTWVDFSAVMGDGEEDACDSGGCGADELKDRIHGETFYNNPSKSEQCRNYIEIPQCTPGDSGVKQAVVDAAEDHILEWHFVPLYDPDQSPCPILPEQLSDDPSAGCGDPAKTKWIADVACVQITGVCKLCLQGEPLDAKCNGPSVIEAVIACDPQKCSSPCGTTTGGAPGPGDLRAVSLLK